MTYYTASIDHIHEGDTPPDTDGDHMAAGDHTHVYTHGSLPTATPHYVHAHTNRYNLHNSIFCCIDDGHKIAFDYTLGCT